MKTTEILSRLERMEKLHASTSPRNVEAFRLAREIIENLIDSALISPPSHISVEPKESFRQKLDRLLGPENAKRYIPVSENLDLENLVLRPLKSGELIKKGDWVAFREELHRTSSVGRIYSSTTYHQHYRIERGVPVTQCEFTVVVNGKETTVTAHRESSLREIVIRALNKTGNSGQAIDNWQLRDSQGNILDAVVGAFGTKLFLNPKIGVGASEKPAGIQEAFARRQCLCGKPQNKGTVYCAECQP